MDLSKVFDTINHELLIAKLNVYRVKRHSLSLLMNNISNRYHKTRVNDMYSTQEELLTGLPQGSVLVHFSLTYVVNDIFYFFEYTKVCNFEDDTTHNSSGLT